MYNLEEIKQQSDLKNPWEIPFEQRLHQLINGHNSGKKMVIYIYEQADTSTFRYRAYNMCQVLKQSKKWGGVYFFGAELECLKKYMSFIDIAIIIRFRWTEPLACLMNDLKRAGIQIFFDVDDLVYDVKYLHLILNTLAVDFAHPNVYDFWFAYISRIYLTALSCDGYVTTNEFIAAKLRADFGKEVMIVPNFLNEEQEKVSDEYWHSKKSLPASKPFLIGYFSGTPSHKNDFETVALELKELLEDYEDIQLKIVGFMELPPYLVDLHKKGRIRMESLKDFRALQREIAEVDVNIIPLIDNEFTNCKSELKYFEASVVGTVTCAVPTYVYKGLIQQGINGYLCKAGEWYSTIEALYKNGISDEVIENAREISMLNYGSNRQVQGIEDVMDSIANK